MSLDDIMANARIYIKMNMCRSVGKMRAQTRFGQEVAVFVPKLVKKGFVTKSSYKIDKYPKLIRIHNFWIFGAQSHLLTLIASYWLLSAENVDYLKIINRGINLGRSFISMILIVYNGFNSILVLLLVILYSPGIFSCSTCCRATKHYINIEEIV